MSEQAIGRYKVLERIGRGGMGVLYRGVDPVLDREVAIKVMAGDFSEDDEGARSRFFREARAAARLQHRNIVTVFEFAEEGGVPYIVMEFLRGQSLAARMAVEPALTLDEMLDIASQLCTGLQFAHDNGVVHRDVKPANVWLRADRTVKLLDFGIAKLSASTVTRHGDVLGSACYMSPEQLAGGAIDGRADVFSTGVVLYEMLAHRKPFDAESPTAVLLQIMQEEPTPIDRLVPGLPAALVAALERALKKSADARYQTAGDFGADLDLIRMAQQSTGETVFGADFDLGDTVCLSGTIMRRASARIFLPAAPVALPAPAPPVATTTRRRPRVVAASVIAAVLVLVILGWLVSKLAGPF